MYIVHHTDTVETGVSHDLHLRKRSYLSCYDAKYKEHQCTRFANFSVARIRAGENVTPHSHKDMHEFFLVQRGTLDLKINGGEMGVYTLHRHDLIHIAPGELHELSNPKPQKDSYVKWGEEGYTETMTSPPSDNVPMFDYEDDDLAVYYFGFVEEELGGSTGQVYSSRELKNSTGIEPQTPRLKSIRVIELDGAEHCMSSMGIANSMNLREMHNYLPGDGTTDYCVGVVLSGKGEIVCNEDGNERRDFIVPGSLFACSLSDACDAHIQTTEKHASLSVLAVVCRR
ncbi:hypothetical protein SARC_04725 [Sphaeroforma arctica JP610]|uniref:Cupin type-2 domain-containing protein n=1 Tax=Sphaeroforma arctica JP610 TaxID=667725 RepID=A0A0L0G1I4_9EUKA|nr:hypothetical protein SARC_04725 [Sphaeroforma arctica JP610]KNC83002.1 hypothetical protein SARC_04725 [Sphaeroforma arctica JP610]|eukprot:XP_014156904.1 hypothetical protein SARC_04725 [Sphaeroforma arctica JP610]